MSEPRHFKYKIEQWEREFSHLQGPFYVAFVRSGWLFPRWVEIGRYNTHEEAKEGLRRHRKPTPGPWLYSEDAL